jgi:hypothetical protein
MIAHITNEYTSVKNVAKLNFARVEKKPVSPGQNETLLAQSIFLQSHPVDLK